MKAGIIGLFAVAAAVEWLGACASQTLDVGLQRPPARYVLEHQSVRVEFLPWADVDLACRLLGVQRLPNDRFNACTYGQTLVMPTLHSWPGTPEAYARLWPHELAHANPLNPWPKDHPQ